MIGTRLASSCLLTVALAAGSAFAEGKGPPPAPVPAPPPSAAAKAGLDLLDKGRVEDAEVSLREALEAKPADLEVRLALGRVLDWDGRPDQAMKCWEQGLAGKDDDVPLLSAMARLHLQRAADGPLVTRRRGSTSMPFGKEAADADAFSRTHYEAALDLWRKAAALRPADREIAFALADLLSELRMYSESVPAFEALSKKDPKNVPWLVGWSRALLGAGRKEDAKARADQALKIAPRDSRALEALSASLKAAGKGPEAEIAHKKAQIYGWLPPFSKLEFSDDLYRKIATMAVDPFWRAKDDAEAKRMWDAKRAIVDAAVALKDEPSYDLLASICWNHCAHGPVEDACFGALEARGKPSLPALLKMVDEGQATCTVGAAARVLARMKEPAAFDAMVRRLPKDVHAVFPMDIAGALVLLGDPRAVAPLVAAMEIDAPPTPKAKPKEKEGRGITVVIGGPEGMVEEGGLDGRPAARGRAVLAVGEFDGPEARAALERGCANPEIAPYCHAVLWRLTKDEKSHGRSVANAVNGDGPAQHLLGPYLERIDHPNAKFLFEAWKKERERVAKAQEEAQKVRDAREKERK